MQCVAERASNTWQLVSLADVIQSKVSNSRRMCSHLVSNKMTINFHCKVNDLNAKAIKLHTPL